MWLGGEGLLLTENSDSLHGPDSYSGPLQPWESMGMFVCVYVCVCVCMNMCMDLCKSTGPLFFTTEKTLFYPGMGLPNVPNCPGGCASVWICDL